MNRGLIILTGFILVSCATRVAVKKDYDFSGIKKVMVLPFKGEGVIGEAVADEFTRQMVMAGIEVMDAGVNVSDAADLIVKARELGVDAVIVGTVSRYKPDQSFLVYREKSNGGKSVVLGNPVIELGSDRVIKRSGISGDDDSFILFTSATLAVSSRMIDAAGGGVVWANSYTYEGLDVESSIGYTVRYFMNSIRPYWNELGVR